MKAVLLSVVACVAHGVCAGNAMSQTLTPDQWRDDLSELRQFVLDTHPRPFRDITRDEWLARFASIHARLETLDDRHAIIAMAELLAALKDGHSRVELPSMHPAIGVNFAHHDTPPPAHDALRFDRLPIELRDFDDGLFVVRASGSHTHLLGTRVTRIGGVDIAQASARIAPAIHAENAQFAKIFSADRLSIVQILSYYGLTDEDGGIVFEFENSAGQSSSHTLAAIGSTPLDWHAVEPPGAVSRQNVGRKYWHAIAGSALYLQYNQVGYDPDHPPLEYVAKMLAAGDKAGVDRLVMDLRHNTGGNSMWMLPFVRAVTRHEVFDRPGGLYVIIGRRTFSAAALLVNELEQHSHALFVGEPSGSRPDTFGDPRKLRLAHSGVTVRVSTLAWKNWLAGEYRMAIAPHIATANTYSDYAAGRDLALDAALAHRMPDSPVAFFDTLLKDTDVNTAALYISKFLLDPRYADRDLKQAMLTLGYRYLKDGDAKNARYTFLLAETYYSNSAAVLAALGLAQETLGRDDEARESYTRALARNPDHAAASVGLARLAAD